jgi:hypothetical protein
MLKYRRHFEQKKIRQAPFFLRRESKTCFTLEAQHNDSDDTQTNHVPMRRSEVTTGMVKHFGICQDNDFVLYDLVARIHPERPQRRDSVHRKGERES